jgi:hypothetical protein
MWMDVHTHIHPPTHPPTHAPTRIHPPIHPTHPYPQASALGDPLQVASLNSSAASLFKQLVAAGMRGDAAGDTCYVQDSEELIYAVEVIERRCPINRRWACQPTPLSGLATRPNSTHFSIQKPQEETCAQVALIGAGGPDTYALPREIVVRRRVLIMGHPLTLPVLDAGQIERAIRVAVSQKWDGRCGPLCYIHSAGVLI